MAVDKSKELLEKIEAGIKDFLTSQKFKDFLKVQSQFHSYSFNNAMLIYAQKPDATRVAGYKTWQKLDRQVMKGEKGIGILAPSPYKYQKEIEVKNPSTGKTEKEMKTVEGLKFKKVNVFDIKQTNGKELPDLCNELQGNSINAEKIIKSIKEISDTPIVEKDITSGAKGYYSRLENIIAVQKGMSLDQTAKTLIHEYAHSQLHNTEAAAQLDRATKEVQAESVSYIVSERFGVDTSEYSFEYLGSWSSGKDLPELKSSFDLIQKTANKFIEKIEDVLVQDLEIKEISSKEASEIIEKRKPLGSFFRKDGDLFVGIDNTTGDAWTEEFKTKEECYRWLKGKELNVSLNSNINIKDKIVKQYEKEFPAIKHISEDTSKVIDNINNQKNSSVTIKQIKEIYKATGKKLDLGAEESTVEEFKTLEKVVDDLKQAQLKEKQIKANEKAAETQLNKITDLEIVQ